MISINPNSNCTEARLYYYDFLSEEAKGNIPQSTLGHITECRHCQDELNRLEALLAQADEDIEQSRQSSAIIAILKLHFACIDKSLTCSTVKAFLPSLAFPTLEISIPTPITAHLDNCRVCSDDLLILGNLGLTEKQLYRLGQLLADKPTEEPVSCSQAQTAIPAVASITFQETTAEILKHLCICPDCRKLLYQHRETICTELLYNKMSQKEFPCEAVSATDIYDYCLPYGIDPANDQYAKFREALTSHLRNCPTCLAKMQQLHTTVCNIADRPDSGVVTCYELESMTKKPEFSDINDLYADWPIKVQVLDKSNPVPLVPNEPVAFPQRLKQKVSALNLKQFIKPVAAAAIILIGILILFSVPAAKAVDLSQIYEALEKIRNVCISRFVPDKAEPIQERWVSRTFACRLTRNNKRFVLWDFANSVKKIKPLDGSTIQIDSLSGDIVAKGKKSLEGSFGLMPFSDITNIPKDAQWNRVDNKDIETPVPGTEVYDLTWTKKVPNTEFWKWRVFIDTTTHLPKRTEWYKKTPIENEYTLWSIEVVAYPTTDNEIKAVIQSTFD